MFTFISRTKWTLRGQLFLFVATGAAIPFLFTTNASAAEPKRVLIVNSFGSAAPPFTIHSTSFESELVTKMGERIALDEVDLDMARNDENEMQQAMVAYLEKRQAKWRPDLVVPIGSPAAFFVVNNYDQLFPKTPILIVASNRQFLPSGAWEKNAVFVGHAIDIPGFFEDMLQVAPATKNIEIVMGATSLERTWRAAFQKAAGRLADRIKFTYYNDLSFDQMLERAAQLPPDSYIFFLLLLRDAGGVTLKSDEALQRLHRVANAPINGLFVHQLGMGIVGGRLLDGDLLGKEAADVAIRILHGEPASSIPPVILKQSPARYDWRELHRWKINEKLLPPGSTVLFREPTVWDRYRTWIIAGVSIFILEALLTTGLLVNLIRRRRAEVSLGESEKRFQTMADAAPVLIWVSGEDRLCTYVNKAWLGFTGRSMEQDLGNGWSEALHPDDVEKALQIYSSAFDAREPFVMQYRLKRHDGEYRRITDQGVPRYGPHGNFRGYVGACVDITDSLKQQRALHEFEERVTLAAEAAYLGVWELNTKTNEVWVSDKVRELYQFQPEQPITYKEFQDRVHPEDRQLHDLAVQRAIETQSGYETDYRISLPDGKVRWIGGRGRCVGDEDGALTRLLGVSMDVTKRKQVEESLARLSERNELILNSAAEGILGLDLQGNHTFVNAAAATMLGYAPEELVGRHSHDLWRHIKSRGKPDFAKECNIYAANQNGKVHRASTGVFWRKDGTNFPVEYSSTPVVDQGRQVGAVVTFMDISARKHAEEQARRQRTQIDLLTRVSLLGEMTAALAHELNQPLAAIVSNASAGMRFMRKGKADSGTLREILVDVAEDAHRANEIIRNVRNTIKQGRPTRQPTRLNDIVKNVAHMVHPDAAAHLCEVKTFLAKNLPVIEADPIQIQEVLINLIGNAFDAMRQTPVSKRKVELTTEKKGNDTIETTVRDYGVGVSDEVGEQLFEQFYTTKKEGLGMGLAIVRSIVEAHGGKVGAENVKGGGARFHFTLPVTKRN